MLPVKFTTTCPPEWENLGFPCTLEPPIVKVQSETIEDFTMEIRSYYYTIINRLGRESIPSKPSHWQRYNTERPVLIGGFTVPANAVSVKIYWVQPPTLAEKLKTHATLKLLVGEIAANEPTFTDTKTIAGEACVTELYFPPSANLRELCSWRECCHYYP